MPTRKWLTSTGGQKGEKEMSDDMLFDDGMGYAADDTSSLYGMDESSLYGADETSVWQLPEYDSAISGPVCTGDGGEWFPHPDDTSIIEVPDLTWPEGPQPSVIDPESEPTVEDPEPPVFPDEEPTVVDPESPVFPDEEPTLPDAEPPVFPEGEGVGTGAAGEAAGTAAEVGEAAAAAEEGIGLLDVLEFGGALLAL
jgi:hypothetical protein